MRKSSVFILIILNLILVSCSSQEIYIIPNFTDQSSTNPGIDIFLTKPLEFFGTDSSDNAIYQNLQKYIKIYFPEGLTMFSRIQQVNWYYYEDKFPVRYFHGMDKPMSGSRDHVTLLDSLENFLAKSKEEFLLIFNGFAWAIRYKNNSNENNGYVTEIVAPFTLWDTKREKLISFGIIRTDQEFKKITPTWPYKSTIIKLANDFVINHPFLMK